MPAIQVIQLRHGTAAAWTSANPTLAAGEMGVETDTGLAKVGTGSAVWTALAYSATALSLSQLAAPTGDLSVASHKLTNLANGVAAQDAATIGQLANALAGLSPAGAPVQAAGSGMTHSGLSAFAIAGAGASGNYTPSSGDRILDVASAVSAGIWVAASGSWTRSTDFATGSNAQGKFVQTEQGGGWACLSSTPVTVDTTSEAWVEIFTGSVNVNGGTP